MGPRTAFKQHASIASVHLDALRGLAALWVLLGHSRSTFLSTRVSTVLAGKDNPYVGPDDPNFYTEPVIIGHFRFRQLLYGNHTLAIAAVIVFFVLSGYLVGGSVIRSMRKGSFSWNKYLFQRLTRLWTVLLPALLLCAILDICGKYLLQSQQNIYHIGPIAETLPSHLTLCAFFGSALFVQGIATGYFGTNNPLWSLSYEFWFYIFFPLLVTALMASKRKSVRVYSGFLLLVLVTACGWKIGAYFLIWLLGAGLAIVPLRLPSRQRRIAAGTSGLLVLITIYLEVRVPFNLFLANLVLGVIVSIFIWSLLHAREISVDSIYRTAAQGLSRMSYTLYLAHYPMLVFLSAVLAPVWTRWPITPRSLLKFLLILVAVFIYSWLVYYCFERNTDRLRNLLGRHRFGQP
jgi:peptidoglycan/LPS O-acetylase OafA/YrhL